MRIKIGDLLVRAGVITELQLKAALAEQSQWGGKLGDILVRMEFLTEEILVRALSKQTGIPRADLTQIAEPAALARIPAEVAEEFGLVPVALIDGGRAVLVAMSDPGNLMITDHLRSLTGARIEARIAAPSAIRAAIARWYRGGEELAEDAGGAMKIVNNSGISVKTYDPRQDGRPAASPPPPPPAPLASAAGAARASAADALRALEETQRRSVAALRAMVELLIDKGVFSRDEYLARVKR